MITALKSDAARTKTESWPSLVVLAAIFIFMLILSEPAARAQDQQSVISDVEKRIEQINRQISELRSRLKEEEKRESSLLSSLEKIRLNKRVLQNEIESLNLRRTVVNRQLNELKLKVAETEKTLQKEKEAVEKTLVTLYRYGRLDFMHFFLKAGNLETFLRESKNLTFLARHQGEAISSYLKTVDQMKALEKELQEKMAEAESLLQQARANQSRLAEEEARDQKLLAEIKKNKSTYQQMVAELQESQEQLQNLLKRLQTQEISLPSPFIPLNERKGKLPWPINGRVITRFGKEKHPKFNTVTVNNGVEITPSSQDRIIKAVHGGRVVFADYFQGYGNLIIIDHGLSYYTLYGHCASFLVRTGDMVRAGQDIAVVGDSDSLKGECLYFEIRHKARPVDPLQWLRRR
ncbi:MAG: peptidoglycan DD-metalloendopeptidase family protein [Candidatus Saccharicenans sp.]|nr:peptidoglycan DD-metalloendopeptidase family protein [Candidatus Saccharicenans sp.]